MSFLGLDGVHWFVLADVVVLVASSTMAVVLFRRLREREREARFERAPEPLAER